MTLAAGTRIGPYEIIATVGAGGMGEVYRALDTQLGRQVAIKVLPDTFANDPERLARFEREAKTLASLNHPNIAQVYGFEKADGIRALVMELVEGRTLADRIAQGRISVDEALPIAKQIAEALEAAHEQGIIHRDLKPANIKLRSDGTVKVLDFGLAKALEPLAGSSPSVSQSPTITTPAMTQMGVILGTAAYMSPEQAKGRPADKRSDIWAFGCVLYEMLTGARAFDAADVPSTIAAVIRAEPDWTKLPLKTPAQIVRLLKRTLRKDLALRLPHIGVARLDLGDEPVDLTDGSDSTRVRRDRVVWGLGAATLASLSFAIFLGARLLQQPTTDAAHVVRMVIPIAEPNRFDPTDGAAIAISPDGTRIVYVANTGSTTQLFARTLDAPAATPLVGTEGGSSPFFSADGRWIGFRSGGALKRIPANGGGTITICRTTAPVRGAVWSMNDTIYFGLASGGPLLRVSASGGTPEPATALGPGEVLHRWPQLLPDGASILYTALSGSNFETARAVVQRLATGDRRIVLEGGSAARYVNSGHLVYSRAEGLFAVPMDLSRLRAGDAPIQVVPNVQANLAALATGGAEYEVSTTGMLVYAPGTARTGNASLVWIDRGGTETPLPVNAPGISGLALSPDESKVALSVTTSETSHIWVYDFVRQTMSRVTFDGSNDAPVWTPDGKRLIFRKDTGNSSTVSADAIYWRHADGSGSDEVLIDDHDHQHYPFNWSGDGRSLLLGLNTQGRFELATFEPQNAGETILSRLPAAAGGGARISWDGKWLAYTSAGDVEVYVQPLPSLGGRWLMSRSGGFQPRWRRDGQELFYMTRNGELTAVPVESDGTSIKPSSPMKLFVLPPLFASNVRLWDVSADGRRFLMVKSIGEPPATQLNVVLNWLEELKRLVPTE